MFSKAREFVNLGIAVVPTEHAGKRPLVRWQEYKTRLPTPTELNRWSIMRCNYAIVTGWRGLAVIDFDNAEVYSHWRRWAAHAGGLPEHVAQRAYRVQSARGVHVYVRLASPTANLHIKDDMGASLLDVLARHQLVTGAGSVHKIGAIYTALVERLYFPIVENVSDILPAALLARAQRPREISPVAWGSSAPALDCDMWRPRETPDYSGSLVARIKTDVKIESFFPTRRPAHGYQMVACPFHEDDHPSAAIYPDGHFYCFAGCTPKPLDVIDLAAALRGLSTREAIHDLARAL